jgi:hypothetical protein
MDFELNEKIIEQVSEFKYVGSVISNYNTNRNLEYRIQIFTKINGGIRRGFGKENDEGNSAKTV